MDAAIEGANHRICGAHNLSGAIGSTDEVAIGDARSSVLTCRELVWLEAYTKVVVRVRERTGTVLGSLVLYICTATEMNLLVFESACCLIKCPLKCRSPEARPNIHRC